MNERAALHRLAGVFEGLIGQLETGAAPTRSNLLEWARRQHGFIEGVLEEGDADE